MWGVILGVVGVALALYEIATRDSDKKLSGSTIANAGPVSPLTNQLRSTQPAVDAGRAATCRLVPTDWFDTDVWSRNYLGASLPLLQRLELMKSVVVMSQWPMFALRVHCAYVTGAQPVQPANFPHGGGFK